MNLRIRLTLLLSSAALGAVLATLLVDQLRLSNMSRELDSLYLQNQAVVWQEVSNQTLEQLARQTSTFSRDPDLVSALLDGDPELLTSLTGSIFASTQNAYLTALLLTDAGGEPLYRSAMDLAVDPTPLTDQVIAGEERASSLLRDARGTFFLALAIPLRDYTGNRQLAGIVLLMSDLKTALEEFSRSAHARAFIQRTDGGIYPPGATGFLQALDQQPVASGIDSSAFVAREGNTYRINYLALRGPDDQPIGHFVSVLDETAQVAERSKVTWLSGLLILGGLLIVIVLITLYLKKAFRPLDELTHAVQRFGAGDTAARIQDTGEDEIGQLGQAFNDMAQQVEDLLERERQATEDVSGKVELIEEVVDLAAKGDLTGQLMVFRDQDVISELANGIQGMMDSLNNLVARIQQSGIQVTSSATEIAATAKEQEATVSEQAATTNQIRTTVTEISATSKELVNTMNEVTDVALQTAEQANTGRSSLERMGETMQHMMDATATISSKLAVLSEKAANINTVVTTINKVADQTNLLSLNAAIEAEKAGEYGVGFAVVATEIRRLADQTAVATWDIEQMVKEMQSAVSSGVMGMEKFSTEVRQGVGEVREVGTQLGKIIMQVENLIPRFEDVHAGMQSQSLGAQQISEAMIQLAESSQQTADSLRQSNGAIMQLNDAARRLQEGVSHFTVNSGDDAA